MRMSSGDFFDRWTILRMKARLDLDAAKEIAFYQKEIEAMFDTEIDKGPRWISGCMEHVVQLAEANAKIWLCEAAIRKEYVDDPASYGEIDVEEVGRRALEIRGYNKLRVESKRAINEIFRETPDNKVEHSSQ